MRKTYVVVTGVVLGLLVSTVEAQERTSVWNPTGFSFDCPDHDRDDAHEIDIIDVMTGTVVQTIQGGDPPADAAGKVIVVTNVQPLPFGLYRSVVRSKGGGVSSQDSEPSEIWIRGPGRPGIPIPVPR